MSAINQLSVGAPAILLLSADSFFFSFVDGSERISSRLASRTSPHQPHAKTKHDACAVDLTLARAVQQHVVQQGAVQLQRAVQQRAVRGG